jgi:hypothetical protein
MASSRLRFFPLLGGSLLTDGAGGTDEEALEDPVFDGVGMPPLMTLDIDFCDGVFACDGGSILLSGKGNEGNDASSSAKYVSAVLGTEN